MSLTQKAHICITQHFASRWQSAKPLYAVDATCGNGHDTLFLLEQGFAHVYAFDVQQIAIQATLTKCAEYSHSRLSVIHASHANMCDYVPSTVDCVMFNLGYLPGAEQLITTHTDSSIAALTQAVDRLNSQGILSVLCYPGHTRGADETKAVTQRLNVIASTAPVTLTRYDSQHPSNTTPVLFVLEKH